MLKLSLYEKGTCSDPENFKRDHDAALNFIEDPDPAKNFNGDPDPA